MGPIKPGDRFFRVMTLHRTPMCGWVIVTKVGRRWADFATEAYPKNTAGRFDMGDFTLDGGNFTSLGRVYRTEEEYRDRVRRSALWRNFCRQVGHLYNLPDTLTAIDILKAADALGFRLKEE